MRNIEASILQCESLYEKSPYVLRLNQSPESRTSAGIDGSEFGTSNVSTELPKDGYGSYLVLVPCFGTRKLFPTYSP